MIVVLTTLPSKKDAQSLSSKLISSRFAACCSMIRIENSTYRWKGKEERTPEFLLLIKTRRALCKKLERFIKKNHPHSCPEIIALPTLYVSKEYEKWACKETR